MIVKSESRRCSNSHSKQCCSNSHTRRSSRRCWCYHRQARPQGGSIGRRTQYPYIFNFLYTHTSRGGDCSPCPPVRLMPPKVLRKKESRRSTKSHSKQCCSKTHTRRSTRRCWCHHRQARPQGSPC